MKITIKNNDGRMGPGVRSITYSSTQKGTVEKTVDRVQADGAKKTQSAGAKTPAGQPRKADTSGEAWTRAAPSQVKTPETGGTGGRLPPLQSSAGRSRRGEYHSPAAASPSIKMDFGVTDVRSSPVVQQLRQGKPVLKDVQADSRELEQLAQKLKTVRETGKSSGGFSGSGGSVLPDAQKSGGRSATGPKHSWATTGKAAWDRGWNQFAQFGGNTLAMGEDVLLAPIELLSGMQLGDLSDTAPFNTWAKSVRDYGGELEEKYRTNREAGGWLAEKAEELGSSAVATLPSSLVSMLAAPASAAQTAEGLVANAAARLAPGKLATISRGLTEMVKNPQYWSSFAQVAGTGYEQALADQRAAAAAAGQPVDEAGIRTKALYYAMGNGLLNAAVEIGGGIQKLPQELQQGTKAWKALVNSAVDEGKEEVIQGIIERAMQNVVYDKKNPLVSVRDPEAIFNPVTSAREWGGGAFVGGLLGAGQIGISGALNAAARRGGDGNAPGELPGFSAYRDNGTGNSGAADLLMQDAARFAERQEAQAEEIPVADAPAQEAEAPTQVKESSVQEQADKTGSQNPGETVQIIQRLKDSIPLIEKQAPVSFASIKSLDSVPGNTLAEKGRALFNAIKGIVVRPGFGNVEINNRSVKDDLSHGVGPAKAAVIHAIPEVIKSGTQIDLQHNWKGRAYDGYVFAAPIVLDGSPVYVAAVVKRSSKNRLYLHEVVDSSGNIIKIGNETWTNPTSLAAESGAGIQVPLPSIEGTRPLNADSTITDMADSVKSGTETQTETGDVLEQEVQRLFGQEQAETETGTETGAETEEQDTGLGAADAGSVNSDYDRLQAQSSEFHPDGEKRARQVDVPKHDFDGNPISKTAATVMESSAIPDEAIPEIEQMIADGKLSYQSVSDAAAIARARQTVREIGLDGAMEQYRTRLANGQRDADTSALGQVLLSEVYQAKNANALAEVMMLHQADTTNHAQALQAARILKMLGPEAQLYGIQKAVGEINRAQEHRRVRNGGLSQEETSAVSETIREAQQEAAEELAGVLEGAEETGGADTDPLMEDARRGGRPRRAESPGWVEQLGRDLARNAASRAAPRTARRATVYETALRDLNAVMREHVQRGPVQGAETRTVYDTVADLLNNRQEYAAAWQTAQNELLERYRDDPAMLEALHEFNETSPLYGGAGPDTTMLRAVTEAALEQDVDLKETVIRGQYDAEALTNQIADQLIRQTGVTDETDRMVLRDAVQRWVSKQTESSSRSAWEYMDADMRRAMREIGVKMSELITQEQGDKTAVRERIVSMLTEQYGVSQEGAQALAEDITRDFDSTVREASEDRLNRMYEPREGTRSEPQTMREKIETLRNLGGFQDSAWIRRTAEYLFGEEHGRSNLQKTMREIGMDMGEIITSSRGDKNIARNALVSYLTTNLGLSQEAAGAIADGAINQFERNVFEASQRKLYAMFRGRPKRTRKLLTERMQELANLGAFSSGREINAAAVSKIFGTNGEIALSQDLIQQYLEQTDDAGRANVIEAMQQEIADQMPSTLLDKWTALRYVNMLGNFKTQLRNVAGNTGMMGVRAIKDKIAAGLEIAYQQVNPEAKRTKSLTVDKGLLAAARADYANVEDIALGGGKYQDGISDNAFVRGIQDKRTIFKNNGDWGKRKDSSGAARAARTAADAVMKGAEGYRKATNWAMTQGDVIFTRHTYARALAGYLQANGITAEQFTSPEWQRANRQTIDQARAYAVQEAQEATFRDNNAVSDWVSKIGRRQDTIKPVRIASEGTLPFRKTPANVLVRAEEYSPLGIANTIYEAVQAKRGNATSADVINSLSKTMTGSMLFAAGLALAKGLIPGIKLRGGEDDDDKQQAFDDLTGHQNYSIEIEPLGNISVTLDWLTPGSMPFFMGVELARITEDGTLEFKDLEQALASISDPMIQMSMMQGVNDALDNIKYSDNNLGQLAATAALGYLTQGLTNSLLGQAERTSESERQTTYIDPNSQVPRWLQAELGRASAKIPGWDYHQQPYVDAWGETESNGDPLMRAASNFFNPAYTDRVEMDSVEQELQRVKDATGDSGVFPKKAEKYFDVNGERKNLTAEEYLTYARKKGQTAREIVGRLTESAGYKQLDDEGKAKAIKDVYEYADAHGKMSVSGYKPGDSSIASGVMKSLLPPEMYILYKLNSDRDGDGKTTTRESAETLLDLEGLTDQQRGKTWSALHNKGETEDARRHKEAQNPFTGVLSGDYSPEQALDAWEIFNGKGTKEDSYTEDKKKQDLAAKFDISKKDASDLYRIMKNAARG